MKYPGSKWNIAPQLVKLIPEHRSYVEPFFGSGAVLFNKTVSDIETINDLDYDVVNLFRCIQEDAERLARMVMTTPFSREKYDETYKVDVWDLLMPEKKGEDYKKFIRSMKSLGYIFDCRELVAADYGAPTTRKRWYAVFRRDGKEIRWPEPTHSRENAGLKRWEECGDYIDWSDLGTSIFDRKKPLAEATQKRIANGIKKYIIDTPDPYIVKDKDALAFIIQYHGETRDGDSRGQLLTEPIKTIDTSNRYGLVTAFVTKYHKSGVWQGCDEPIYPIDTSSGDFGITAAFITKYYKSGIGQGCDDPRIHANPNCRYRSGKTSLDIIYELIKAGMLKSSFEKEKEGDTDGEEGAGAIYRRVRADQGDRKGY